MTGPLLEPALVEALGRIVPGVRRTALAAGGGLHRSAFKGAGVDFRQHRMYVRGDDVRRLDWRVLARTDRPFIREYDDESTLRTMAVVDGSGSMAYGVPTPKTREAASLAAALAYVALAGGENAGLTIAGEDGPETLVPSAARSQFTRIIDRLERLDAKGPTTLDATLARVAPRVGRRAVVLVISDLLLPPEKLRAGLARLRHGRHDVTLVRVLHRDEIEFPFRGFVRFAGLEAERPTTATAATTRGRYLAAFDRHAVALRAVCRATRTTLIDHTVGRPLIDTVHAVVRRGRA